MKKLILSLILVSGLFAESYTKDEMLRDHSAATRAFKEYALHKIELLEAEQYVLKSKLDAMNLIINSSDFELCQRDFKDPSQFPKE